jgi:hypothetical protein
VVEYNGNRHAFPGCYWVRSGLMPSSWKAVCCKGVGRVVRMILGIFAQAPKRPKTNIRVIRGNKRYTEFEPTGYKKTILSDLKGAWECLREAVVEHAEV